MSTELEQKIKSLKIVENKVECQNKIWKHIKNECIKRRWKCYKAPELAIYISGWETLAESIAKFGKQMLISAY